MLALDKIGSASRRLAVLQQKTLLMLLAFVLAATFLVGCGGTQTPAASGNDGQAGASGNISSGGNLKTDATKLNVVTTIFAPYDFTREIAGDAAQIDMLLPPGAESHSFEPTPQDLLKIQNCDLFIYIGGESEQWVEGVLSSLDSSQIRVLALMDCVQTLEEEYVEGMQAEEELSAEQSGKSGGSDQTNLNAQNAQANQSDEAEEEAELDEHIWTSVSNAKVMVQTISDALCDLDPTNAAYFTQNTGNYINALNKLDDTFKTVVSDAKRNTIIFADRFPFRYFVEEYGLNYYAAFPGCASETEASAATLRFLIDKVNSEQIPVVFKIELSSAKIAETIAEATGAEILEMHSCHNITKSDFDAGKSYISIMTQNSEALRQALN